MKSKMTSKITLAHDIMEPLTLESAVQVRRGDKVYIRDMNGERLNAVREGEKYQVRGVFRNKNEIFYAIEVKTSLGEPVIRYAPYSWCSVERHIKGSNPRNLGNKVEDKTTWPIDKDIPVALKSQVTLPIKRNFNDGRR